MNVIESLLFKQEPLLELENNRWGTRGPNISKTITKNLVQRNWSNLPLRFKLEFKS